jgi:tuftelin-interacting protein 11
MGFQPGIGLSKDLQGIAAPVEAHLRRGRGTIGAYVLEKVQNVADFSQIQRKKKQKNLWKNYPRGGRVMSAIKKRKCIVYIRALMTCWNKVKRPAAAGENTVS